jgi:hypothetical protein
LTAFLRPAVLQWWAQSVLLCAHGPFWTLERGGLPRAEQTPLASGRGTDLWPSEKMLPEAQAGARHACDAARNRGRSQRHEASGSVSPDG